ncbi:MAG: hypothetical protein CMN87_09095 [Stappia sp.]|nr:hypothetical protein [Stappia sp.]MBM20153.1 hypothetical protein [Stappia sp.]
MLLRDVINTDTRKTLKAMNMHGSGRDAAGSATAAPTVPCLAAVLFLLAVPAGAEVAETSLPAACTANRVAPFEDRRLAGPDMRGDFTDAQGHLFAQADLVPLDTTAQPAMPARDLRFHDIAGRPDRWNRRTGLLLDAGDGSWLALDEVASGRAGVLPARLSPACLAPLLAAEETARRAGRGAWADHRVPKASEPDTITRLTGRFSLVEGRVLGVGETRSTLYLNFGYRWRDDFTVTISASSREEFAAAGLDVAALEGAAIRVRGIVQTRDGPLIKVSHPAQIERLDKDGMRR